MNYFLTVLTSVLLLNAPLQAEDAHEEQASEGAIFKEGSGVMLGAATAGALGLTVVEVEDRKLGPEVRLFAQIYREAKESSQNSDEPTGFAYASALIPRSGMQLVPEGVAIVLTHREHSATGRMLRFDTTMEPSSDRIEGLIQIEDPVGHFKIGDFATAIVASPSSSEVTVIPASAVLSTAYGDFAFVENGSAFLRTAIKVGARQGDVVEIIDGLYAGDRVVATPVQALYLIELRATKGGGHSH